MAKAAAAAGPAAPKEKKKSAAAQPAAQAASKQTAAGEQPARLQLVYREKIVPDLMKKFGYKSVMQVPRVQKITLNMGVDHVMTFYDLMDKLMINCKLMEVLFITQ